MVRKRQDNRILSRIARALHELTGENAQETQDQNQIIDRQRISRAIFRNCRRLLNRQVIESGSSEEGNRSRSRRRHSRQRIVRRRDRSRYIRRNQRTRSTLRRLRRLLLRNAIQFHSGDLIIPMTSADDDDGGDNFRSYVIDVQVDNQEEVGPNDSYSNRNVPFFVTVSNTGVGQMDNEVNRKAFENVPESNNKSECSENVEAGTVLPVNQVVSSGNLEETEGGENLEPVTSTNDIFSEKSQISIIHCQTNSSDGDNEDSSDQSRLEA